MWAEGTIGPSGRNSLLFKPHDFLICRVVRRNIWERRSRGKVHGGATRKTVEIRCHLGAIHRVIRTESAIGKTGHNTAIRVPTNLCVERIRGRKVAVPCAKTVTACIEGLCHDERQVIILVAKTWDQFHLGIGKAAVAVRSVALFNRTSGAPRWRVRCTRSIGGADPPVHRLVLNVLRCLGLHALITAARNEDRTAARAPCALTIRIQFIGDKLGASRITHRPHL